ncbi:hypothetical protein ES703_120828 [subsurface metagenome]
MIFSGTPARAPKYLNRDISSSPTSVLISIPGTTSIPNFSPLAIASSKPATLSWSVMEIAARFSFFARETTSRGVQVPSEYIVCICKSIFGKIPLLFSYYLNWEEEEFLAQLEKFQAARAERNRKLIKKLKELGMEINHGELKGLSGRGVISRLHIARLMVRKEYVSSIGNAFERWLNPGKPAYVKKMNVSPFQIIELILKTGGVPVFAHPFLSKRDDLIPHLVKAGLKGIEVYHSAHDSRVTQYYQKVAQKYHLLITGGSDCHGEAKDRVLMGKVKVPVSVLRVLKKAAREEALSVK